MNCRLVIGYSLSAVYASPSSAKRVPHTYPVVGSPEVSEAAVAPGSASSAVSVSSKKRRRLSASG